MKISGFFKDLSIRGKMLVIFGISAFFIASIIAAGLYNMVRMKNASEEVYERSFSEVRRYMKLKADLEDVRRTLLTMLIEADEKGIERHSRSLDAATAGIDGDLRELTSLEDPDSAQAAKELSVLWELFKYTRDNTILPSLRSGRRELAASLASGVQEERFRRMIGLSAALIERGTRQAGAAQDAIKGWLRKTIAAYAALAACGLAVAVGLIVWLTNDITGSMKTINEAMERYKSGEDEIRIEGASKDEIGALAEGLNRMFRRLYEDRVERDQYMNILDWQAKESEKAASELALANASLYGAQAELEEKNRSLESYVGELKDANQKLADTHAQMIQSEKLASIGQLAAGVAHEINNPIAFVGSNLNALDAYVADIRKLIIMYSVLEDKISNSRPGEAEMEVKNIAFFKEASGVEGALDDARELLKESTEGVKRVAGIVQGLKDFSHVDSAESAECDINKCVEDTLKIAWHEIKYRAELKKEPGEIATVVCRPRQLNQVFLNIIINAAQSISGEKGEIRVRTFMKDGSVAVEVRDNGCGMTEEVRKRIFDPFFTTKPVGRGTGLGLAIAYGIVREHGGSIDVESAPGKGSAFTVTLPVRSVSAHAGRLSA